MNKQYSWMWIAGASVLALAIGFGLARWTQAPPAASAAQAGATAGHGDDAQAGGEEGVSPGQACVFYDAPSGQARVLGGGFIKSASRGASINDVRPAVAAQPVAAG